MKELKAKDQFLKNQKEQVNKLAEQLDMLQKELASRESAHNTMKCDISRIEVKITEALVNAGNGAMDKYHLQSLLEEILPTNLEQMHRLLNNKDEEITKLKEVIDALSSEWRIKNKGLELQVWLSLISHLYILDSTLKKYCIDDSLIVGLYVTVGKES